MHSVIQSIKSKKQFIMNFGLNTFLEAEWVRMRIPSLLRTFWLSRMAQQLISIVMNKGIGGDPVLNLPYSDAAARLAINYILEVGRDLVVRGAETLIAVLGMTR
jgi:E3 ubiquitin-protein ligase RNF139